MLMWNQALDEDGQKDTLKLMNELHRQENEGYTTHVVSKFPNIRDFDQRVSFGTFSWTLHKDKVKLIKRGYDHDIGAGPQTPSSIAREYLEVCYRHRRRRATASQKEAIMLHRSHPLYFRPAHLSHGVYVDVVSTYLTLMLMAGWDVDYNPGRWVVPGRSILDFPAPTIKLARNCLVTLGLSSPNYTWTGKRYTRSHGKNPFINYGLWAFIQDTLHCLACDAIECGAVYVHTDGYIFPAECVQDFYERAASWQIPVKVKAEGPSWVMGVGNFRVGDKAVRKLRSEHTRPFSNIRMLPYRYWLQHIVRTCVLKQLSERVYYKDRFRL